MARNALLIGIQDYGHGIAPVRSAPKDIDALHDALHHSSVGYFHSIQVVKDEEISSEPGTHPIGTAELAALMQAWCRSHEPDDLALLYISGQGFRGVSGDLYIAASNTYLDPNGLVDSTTIPFYSLVQWLDQSLAREQVVVLDCCFSDHHGNPLGHDPSNGDSKESRLDWSSLSHSPNATLREGSHRVVLAPSSTANYFSDQKSDRLSMYTRYWLEGLMTGAADDAAKQWTSVTDIHRYVCQQMAIALPNITPVLVDPGNIASHIRLGKASIPDVHRQYRHAVQSFAQLPGQQNAPQGQILTPNASDASPGERPDQLLLDIPSSSISAVGRQILDLQRHKWGLSSESAEIIEQQVIQPLEHYARSLNHYRSVMTNLLEGRVFNEQVEQRLREQRLRLGLRSHDVAGINHELSYLQKLRHTQQYREALTQAIATTFPVSDTADLSISDRIREELTVLQGMLALTDADVQLIEQDVMAERRTHHQRLTHYQQRFSQALEQGIALSPLVREELDTLQSRLGLSNDDVERVEWQVKQGVTHEGVTHEGVTHEGVTHGGITRESEAAAHGSESIAMNSAMDTSSMNPISTELRSPNAASTKAGNIKAGDIKAGDTLPISTHSSLDESIQSQTTARHLSSDSAASEPRIDNPQTIPPGAVPPGAIPSGVIPSASPSRPVADTDMGVNAGHSSPVLPLNFSESPSEDLSLSAAPLNPTPLSAFAPMEDTPGTNADGPGILKGTTPPNVMDTNGPPHDASATSITAAAPELPHIDNGLAASISQYEQAFMAAIARQLPISESDRQSLHQLQHLLGLSDDQVRQINHRIMDRETQKEAYYHQTKIQTYLQKYVALIEQEWPLSDTSRNILLGLQTQLELHDADIHTLEHQTVAQRLAKAAAPPPPNDDVRAGNPSENAATDQNTETPVEVAQVEVAQVEIAQAKIAQEEDSSTTAIAASSEDELATELLQSSVPAQEAEKTQDNIHVPEVQDAPLEHSTLLTTGAPTVAEEKVTSATESSPEFSPSNSMDSPPSLSDSTLPVTELESDESSSEILLKTERDIDYSNLEKYLSNQEWLKADTETLDILRELRSITARRMQWLDRQAIFELPCTDLMTIDALWYKHSKGRFGFRVQQEIFDSTQTTNSNVARFGKEVGWTLWQSEFVGFKYYKQLTFNLTAPRGHLPAKWFWTVPWWESVRSGGLGTGRGGCGDDASELLAAMMKQFLICKP